MDRARSPDSTRGSLEVAIGAREGLRTATPRSAVRGCLKPHLERSRSRRSNVAVGDWQEPCQGHHRPIPPRPYVFVLQQGRNAYEVAAGLRREHRRCGCTAVGEPEAASCLHSGPCLFRTAPASRWTTSKTAPPRNGSLPKRALRRDLHSTSGRSVSMRSAMTQPTRFAKKDESKALLSTQCIRRRWLERSCPSQKPSPKRPSSRKVNQPR